ncbi:MAG TPA: DUF937 domain-containing protein [Candidatus Sulfomarinibacteraceae bacterium]|nr:DUF937 domain-containing protein [Candidatus Sulfomarinibacteraceae bacterium]
MNLTDILDQVGGLQSMASELGISESQARQGASALLPAILGGFKKQVAAQPTGLEGLGGLLGQLGGGSLLDDLLAPRPTDVSRGNDVLGQIFGSKDVSRTVANHASASTGLDSGLLKKMLPMLAMAVAGLMARSGATQGPAASPRGGGLGDLLGGLAGSLGGGRRSAGGDLLGGLASMLDADGDGNPLDDILGAMGR